ncbi:hypothetical protein VIBNIAM115_1050024 [Vibrio nigripulchritudo AM115]|nr:hypothetical protein VIBNIAM115_1050024 [Vibrio nigripulchritudo AM115]
MFHQGILGRRIQNFETYGFLPNAIAHIHSILPNVSDIICY